MIQVFYQNGVEQTFETTAYDIVYNVVKIKEYGDGVLAKITLIPLDQVEAVVINYA